MDNINVSVLDKKRIPRPVATVDTTINCPVCHQTVHYIDTEASQLIGLREPYQVMVCSECGLGRLTPHLGPMEMETLYAQAYFDSPHASQVGFEDVEPVEDYANTIASRIPKFSQTLNVLKKKFPGKQKFLDVGASTGDMVAIARQAGYQAEGVETSEFAVKRAREKWGIQLMKGSLSEIETESYDIVHLNHVFEHFTNPVAELKNMYRILRNGGGLYLEIPYQFHVIERLHHRFAPRRVPFSLHSVHHPFFYTPNTIRRILRDHGFQVHELNVFSADRYPDSTSTEQIKRLLWKMISLIGIGNYIELIAIKRTSPVEKN